MSENATLGDFLESTDGETIPGDEDGAANRDEGHDPVEAAGSEAGNVDGMDDGEAGDADAVADEAGDADAVADEAGDADAVADEAGDADAMDDGSIEPVRPPEITARWAADGTCSSCDRTTERLWFDGEDAVCGRCRSW